MNNKYRTIEHRMMKYFKINIHHSEFDILNLIYLTLLTLMSEKFDQSGFYGNQ